MIKIIAVGRVKEDYSKNAAADYIARIKHYTKIDVIELKEDTIEKEAAKILEKIENKKYIVLDAAGKQFDSLEFTQFIKRELLNNLDIVFVIGSSEGLSQEVIQKATNKISLSRMTFAHGMCRVFLLEQIYRAFTIMNNQKYHK